MNIFAQELKRIFRPLPVIVIAALTVWYALTMIKMPYDWLTTLHEPSDTIHVGQDLIERYGPTLEPDERKDAERTLTSQYAEAMNRAIGDDPRFAAAGVEDAQDYYNLDRKIAWSGISTEDASDREATEMYIRMYNEEPDSGWFLVKSADGDVLLDTEALEKYDPAKTYALTPEEEKIADYIFWGDLVGHNNLKLDYLQDMVFPLYDEMVAAGETYFTQIETETPREAALIEAIAAEGYTNIKPHSFDRIVFDTAQYLAGLILVTLCVLFAPHLTQDNMTGTVQLQYASRIGRKIVRRQLAAMLVSACCIAVFEIGVTAFVFLRAGWADFLDVRMNSFMDHGFYWFSGTVGQYLLYLAAMIFALAIACAFAVFVLSKLSKHYIGLLLGLIPWTTLVTVTAIFALTGAGAYKLARFSGLSDPLFYSATKLPFAEAYVCALLLLIATAAAVILAVKQRKAEI